MKLRIFLLPLLLVSSLGLSACGSGNGTTTYTTTIVSPPSFSGQCIDDATGVVRTVLLNLGEPGVNNFLNSAQILFGENSRTWQAIHSGIFYGIPITDQHGYVKGINAALTALTSVCQGGLG